MQHRRLDWLLPQWLEDANAYSQSINEDILSVIYTFTINAVLFLLALLLFSILRRYDSDLFAPKVKLLPKNTPAKLSSSSLFGWMIELWNIPDSVIIETSGYDVMFFIRFYRFCFRILSYAVIYCWCILLPINGFGNSIVYSKDPDAFDHWSMKNIEASGNILWFHFIGVVLFTLITMIQLEQEYIVYAKYRHAFLRQTFVKTRTIFIQGIPHKMRSPDTLRYYFEALYPGCILKVHLTQNLKHLERMIKQREEDVTKLERCMYQFHQSNERPTVKVGNMQQEVDAIRYYTRSLDDLNSAIAKEQAIAKRRAETNARVEATLSGGAEVNAMIISEFLKVTGMSNAIDYASSHRQRYQERTTETGAGSYQNSSHPITSASPDGEEGHNSKAAQLRESHYESLSVADTDSDEEDAYFLNYSKSNGTNRGLLSFQEYRMSTADWLHSIWTAPTVSECWRIIKQGRKGEDHEYYHRPLHQNMNGYQVDTDDYSETYNGEGYTDNSNNCDDKDALIKPPEERHFFMSKAFITFKGFAAVSTARQILHMQQAGRMTVSEAPEPSDIIWSNMYTTRKGVLWIKLCFDVLITLLIVVWVAPVTLLSFVFSKDAITSHVHWIDVWCDQSHLFSSLIELLQPLAIVAIMNLLPPVMTAIAVFEGSLTLSETQFRSFRRYFAFQIVNVFLVTVIAGSVVDVIANIYDNPEAWFSLLGSSLPKMGGFFLNYILVKAFTGLGMEIIRAAAACCALLKKTCTPNTTPRDRRAQALFGAARNMSNPGWFPFAKIYAQDMLTFTICATYACVAPLILIGGLCYFAIASFIYKHQMLYVYQPYFETGGLWWPILARCFVIALIFAQSLMIGMMLLKQSYQQIYFLVALIVLTLSYYWYLRRVYEPLAKQLPLDMAKAMDHQEDLDAHNDETNNSHTDESGVSRYNYRSHQELLAASYQYAQPPLRAVDEAPILDFDPVAPHNGRETDTKVLPV